MPLITHYFIGSLLYTLVSLIWFVIFHYYLVNKSMPKVLLRLAELIGAVVRLSVPKRRRSVAVIKLINEMLGPLSTSTVTTQSCNNCDKCEQCKKNAELGKIEQNLTDIYEKKVLIINFVVLIVLTILFMLTQIFIWMSW